MPRAASEKPVGEPLARPVVRESGAPHAALRAVVCLTASAYRVSERGWPPLKTRTPFDASPWTRVSLLWWHRKIFWKRSANLPTESTGSLIALCRRKPRGRNRASRGRWQ
jgi:hypothetical protein